MRKILSGKYWAILNGVVLFILTLVLLTILFVEDQWGYSAVCYWVYHARWFKFLIILVLCVIITNLFVFHLFKKNIFIGLFHIALLVLILGFCLVDQNGKRGRVFLSQGQSVCSYTSERPFFKVKLESGSNQEKIEKEVFLSPSGACHLNLYIGSGKDRISIDSRNFYTRAVSAIIPDSKGTSLMELIVGTNHGMKTIILQQIRNGLFIEPDSSKEIPPLSIGVSHGKAYLSSKDTLHALNLSTQQHDQIIPGKWVPADKRLLYSTGKIPFLFGHYLNHAAISYTEGDTTNAERLLALTEITWAGQKKIIPVSEKETIVKFGNSNLKLTLKYKKYPLPFILRFDGKIPNNAPENLRRYIVGLTQLGSHLEKRKEIFKNRGLEYDGYYMALLKNSNTNKELALAILSPGIGKIFCYIGFAMLILSIIWYIFYCAGFNRWVKQRNGMRFVLILLLAGCLTSSFSYAGNLPQVDSKVANRFGRLWVKSVKTGHIETMNTLNQALLRKISGHFCFNGQSADQIILGMMVNPLQWQNICIIKTHRDLAAEMGFHTSRITYRSVFDAKGNYLFAEDVREARSKNYEAQTPYDRVIIDLDDKVTAMTMIFNGSYLYIIPNKQRGSWLNPVTFHAEENLVQYKDEWDTLGKFFLAVSKGENSMALEALHRLIVFQEDTVSVPSNMKRDAELLYGKILEMNFLPPGYMLVGIVLLLMEFIRSKRLALKVMNEKIFFIAGWGLIGLHLGIILLKWYITRDYPWLNSTDWLSFLMFGSVFLGGIMGKKDGFSFGSSCLWAGVLFGIMDESGMGLVLENTGCDKFSAWENIYILLSTVGLSALLFCVMQNLWLFVLVLLKRDMSITYKSLHIKSKLTLRMGLGLLVLGLVAGMIGSCINLAGVDTNGIGEIWLMLLIVLVGLIALFCKQSKWRPIVIITILPVLVVNICCFYSYFLENEFHIETNLIKVLVGGSVLVEMGLLIVLNGKTLCIVMNVFRKKE